MRPGPSLLVAISATLALGTMPAGALPAKPAHAKVAVHALKLTLRATGTKGTLSGKPFGTGRVTIEVDPPQYYLMTWRFSRGSIVALVWLPEDRKGAVSGTQCHWVIAGGTGRYAHIRGAGTMVGQTDGRTWTVTVAGPSVRY